MNLNGTQTNAFTIMASAQLNPNTSTPITTKCWVQNGNDKNTFHCKLPVSFGPEFVLTVKAGTSTTPAKRPFEFTHKFQKEIPLWVEPLSSTLPMSSTLKLITIRLTQLSVLLIFEYFALITFNCVHNNYMLNHTINYAVNYTFNYHLIMHLINQLIMHLIIELIIQLIMHLTIHLITLMIDRYPLEIYCVD